MVRKSRQQALSPQVLYLIPCLQLPLHTPPYFLNVIYPIAIVMVRIHSLGVATIGLRSMVLVICNILSIMAINLIYKLLDS
jgi:hypothetical protein